MNESDPNKWIKLSIVAGVLLISFSIFYYLVIFIPQKERDKLEYSRQQELKLQSCLADVYVTYRDMWARDCKEYGIDNKDEGCSLPSGISENLNKYHKEQQEECYKVYPLR